MATVKITSMTTGITALMPQTINISWSITGLLSGEKIDNFTVYCNNEALTFSNNYASNIRSAGISVTASGIPKTTGYAMIQIQARTTYEGSQGTSYDSLGIEVKAPGAGSAPTMTAPAAGAQIYTNQNLTVSWKYNGATGVPQAGATIEGSTDGSAFTKLLDQSGAATSAIIPAGKISVAHGQISYYIRVYTWDAIKQNSPKSSPVMVIYKAITPDKPVPTKPADKATLYPFQPMDISFSYTDNGGYGLKQVILRWYKSGEAAWSHTSTFNVTSPNITVPANTFTVGTVYWSISAINTHGDQSLWSDTRTLTVAYPAAPTAPNLLSPTAGTSFFVNANISVSWKYNGTGAQASAEIQWSTSATSGFTTVATVAGTSTSGLIPANVLAMASGQVIYYLRIITKDEYGQTSPASSVVQITMRSTKPDKPVPTKPADGATSYPKMALAVGYNYASNGGYALKQVVFNWYISGETAWGRSMTIVTSSAEISVPANTFPLGTIYWRIQTINTNNQASDYSDGRKLIVASSAPLAPTPKSPDNNATLYNIDPVTFSWQYNVNAGVAQGEFEVQWRLRDATAWTTAAQTSAANQYIVAAATVPIGMVEWRVRTANTLGEWSAYSDARTFTYAIPAPFAPEITEPIGGYVDRMQSVIMSWTYSSPINAPMASGQIGYRLKDQTWQYVSVGAVTTHTFAPGILPSGDIEIDVMVRDTSGRTSARSAVVTFTTREPVPEIPTLIEPVDIYVPISSNVKFTWIHNSPVNAPQARAEVQYTQGGGEWITAAINGTAQTYTVSAFTLLPGTLTWRARTFNREGDASAWSGTANAGITGAPSMPVITQIDGVGSRLTIHWTAPGQIGWEIYVQDELGNIVVHETGEAGGDNTVYRLPVFLTPGIYGVRIRARNQYDLWSEYASIGRHIQYEIPDAPRIALRQLGDAVEISIIGVDFDRQRAIIYRDGIPIGYAQTETFVDATAGGSVQHTYVLRAMDARDAFVDSAPQSIAIKLTRSWLTMHAGGDVSIIANVNGGPSRAAQHDIPVSIIDVEGREKPVAEFGTQVHQSYTVEYGAQNLDELNALYRVKTARAPVLYRDTYGRRDWCVISGTVERDIEREIGARSVSIALTAIDYDESIEIE